MITPQEFSIRWQNTRFAHLVAENAHCDERDLWGCSPLVRYEPASVNTLPLSEETKRFLCESGLPNRIHKWHFDYLPMTLPSLPNAVLGYTFPEEYARYRVFGVGRWEVENFCFGFLCLDLEMDGRVVVIWTLEKEVRLLNSSLPQFAEHLLLLRNFEEWRLTHHPYPLAEPDDIDLMQHLKLVVEQMKRIDPFEEHNLQFWGWDGFGE